MSPPTSRDRAWQLALWTGFRIARLWWTVTRQPHEGALVAVHVGPGLLLVRTSYRRAWTLPGGGIKAGEAPAEAARRELAEETGIRAELTERAGVFTGLCDGRPDRVHIYELRLDSLPRLLLDNREVVAARLFSPAELDGLDVTGPVAAYLGRGGVGQDGGRVES